MTESDENPGDKVSDTPNKGCCHDFFLMRRFHFIFMLFLLMVIIYGMRTELGLAMLKINESLISKSFSINSYNSTFNSTRQIIRYLKKHELPKNSKVKGISTQIDSTTVSDGNSTLSLNILTADVSYQTRRWSSYLVGFIESSFYLGYMIFSIPSGIIANTWSPKKFLSICIGMTCSLNTLLPLIVSQIQVMSDSQDVHPKISFAFLFVFRLLQGMAEASIYSCVHSLVSYWAPQSERSRMVSVILLGTSLGPIIGYPLIGYLIYTFTWDVPFYLFGGMGLFWVSIWTMFFYETPSKDPYIQERELKFITKTAITNRTAKKNLNAIPWKAMLSSTPVWAILFANLGRNWIFQFSFVGIPRFIKDVSVYEETHGGHIWSKNPKNPGLNEERLGQFMLIPFLSMATLTPISGILADFFIKRKTFSVQNTRKFLHTLSYSICATCILALGFVKVVWLAILLVTLALGFVGLGSAGFGANHLDIGPSFTGIIMGLSNAFGTISGIVCPIVARSMVHGHNLDTWNHFFILCFCVECFCALFFLIFASGEIQPWAVKRVVNDADTRKTN